MLSGRGVDSRGRCTDATGTERQDQSVTSTQAFDTPQTVGNVALPDWVPRDAQLYLAHTEHGVSMRDLAQQVGCHASTVMRRIRKLESRRDDQLVDLALRRLGQQSLAERGALCETQKERPIMSDFPKAACPDVVATLEEQAVPVLKDLEAKGAVLAVAETMEKAVVVIETQGDTERRAVVDRTLAEGLALQGWIHCDRPGRISRYRISEDGRAVLRRREAAQVNGFSEVGAAFTYEQPVAQMRPAQVPGGETPLALLARRRDKSGRLFLDPALVRAGERLREDFELAQLSRLDEGGNVSELQTMIAAKAHGSSEAKERMLAALQDLGPGLADVCLRCCCYLEGLETAEKRMGWSARSGKIVLRIALQRLKRYYEEAGTANALIY